MGKWWSEGIKRLDAYPKTLEDFRIQTLSGGAITVLSGILMIFLFASEIRDYLTPKIREELFVDTSKGGKLQINLDIVFSSISCDFLVLDAMDVSGESHIDIAHNIYKGRLDLNGNPLEVPVKERSIGESAKILNKTSEKNVTCGSCYGAETERAKCCNVCSDVKEAYRLKGWDFEASKFEQCKDMIHSKAVTQALKEGCRIYGYLEVNRVGGSFHIAPGKSFSINHMHVHDVQPFASTDFNLTHKINHLSFGSEALGGKHDPLGGVEGSASEGATMFQYYLKIVPTLYSNFNGMNQSTNQYSVTRLQKSISAFDMGGMPGVFFNYELAPLMVRYSQKERSFGHFATGLCAIIGGIFTIAGIIDKFVYSSSKLLQRKFEIGKAT